MLLLPSLTITILRFRLGWFSKKKKISSPILILFPSTMAANAERGCVRGRWAEHVDFYIFQHYFFPAHRVIIKVYAMTALLL